MASEKFRTLGDVIGEFICAAEVILEPVYHGRIVHTFWYGACALCLYYIWAARILGIQADLLHFHQSFLGSNPTPPRDEPEVR